MYIEIYDIGKEIVHLLQIAVVINVNVEHMRRFGRGVPRGLVSSIEV
jgi:hypothetical protein